MPNNKQETVDTLYVKYQRTLELLSNAIDENEIKDKTIAQLQQELDAKPKEVEKEVEKIVEVEADIDLTTPSRVAELEAKLAKKLNPDVN